MPGSLLIHQSPSNMPRMPSMMIALYPSRGVTEQLSMWRASYEVDPPYPVYDPMAADPSQDGDLRVVPPWEMHVTLLHYPEISIEQAGSVINVVKRVARSLPKQTGRVGGYGEFITGYEFACVALVDSRDLEGLRDRLIREIGNVADHSTDHAFTPHITLAYSYMPEGIVLQNPPELDLVFDAITVVYGYDGPAERFPFGQVTKTDGVLQEKVDDAANASDDSASNPESVTTSSGGNHMEVVVSKAVWSTAFINDLPDSAFLYVESGGEKDGDGKTTPRSLRHFPVKGTDGEVDLPHLRNAIARIPQSNAPGLTASKKASLQERARTMLESANKTDEGEKAGRRMSGSMRAMLSDATDVLKRLVAWAGYQDDEEDEDEMAKAIETGELVIFKDAAGDDRWISFSSNAFKDREEEIVATKALEDEVLRAETEDDRGTLRLWHIKGTDIGDCDFQGVHGRFLIESGTFRDTELSRQFRAYAKTTTDKLGTSIGFRYPEAALKGGVYTEITKIFERSVCPLEMAANPWTSFETIPSGGIMDNKQKEWLAKFAGADRAQSILMDAEEATKQLEGLHAFKATKAEEPVEAPTPDPAPEDPPEEPDGDTVKARAELLEAVGLVMDAKLAPVMDAIKMVDAQGQANADAIKAIVAEREDEKTKAANTPRAAGHRASEVDSNVLDFEQTKKALEGSGDEHRSPVAAWVDDIIGPAKAGGSR